jgi:hypothetical protein
MVVVVVWYNGNIDHTLAFTADDERFAFSFWRRDELRMKSFLEFLVILARPN